jgi:hypothetical protein
MKYVGVDLHKKALALCVVMCAVSRRILRSRECRADTAVGESRLTPPADNSASARRPTARGRRSARWKLRPATISPFSA